MHSDPRRHLALSRTARFHDGGSAVLLRPRGSSRSGPAAKLLECSVLSSSQRSSSMIWRKVLVPHDFSSSANHAAALARDEAKRNDGWLVLLHVVELPLYLGADSTQMIPEG